MKAITILRYMTDNVDVLPLGVTTRLVVTHDTPILFIQLLEEKPWIKRSRDGNSAQVFEGSDLGPNLYKCLKPEKIRPESALRNSRDGEIRCTCSTWRFGIPQPRRVTHWR